MTATQWLFDKLWDTPKDKFEWYAILKEAEEKFQDDVTEAFDDGQWDYCTCTVNGTEPKEPKEYYNETFGIDKRNKTD
jgi:hypothetical protein